MQYLDKLRRLNVIINNIEKDIIDAMKFLGVKTIKIGKSTGSITLSKVDPKLSDQLGYYVYHLEEDKLKIYCGLADKMKHLRTHGTLVLAKLDEELKTVYEWIEYDKSDGEENV